MKTVISWWKTKKWKNYFFRHSDFCGTACSRSTVYAGVYVTTSKGTRVARGSRYCYPIPAAVSVPILLRRWQWVVAATRSRTQHELLVHVSRSVTVLTPTPFLHRCYTVATPFLHRSCTVPAPFLHRSYTVPAPFLHRLYIIFTRLLQR